MVSQRGIEASTKQIRAIIEMGQPRSIKDVQKLAYHRGTVAVSFELRRMLNSMVNARDSRFILVQALDRRSSNDPTSSRR